MKYTILVQNFIDQIWNKSAFENLETFLHPDFKDYSLPPQFPKDKEGTKSWIIQTGLSFKHNTIIEDQITEGEKSVIKIKMNLQHIGVWRSIEPTGLDLNTTGYRYFTFKDGKIIQHHALIDGQSIESILKQAHHGVRG